MLPVAYQRQSASAFASEELIVNKGGLHAGLRSGLPRREFLRLTASGLAVVGSASLLTACGGKSASPSTSAAPAGPPARGGTLRFGVVGGASSDTLEAQNPVTIADLARVPQLFDSLITQTATGAPEMRLATEITPNAAATQWTIKLRDGVVFHNGKKFTGQDVMFSLRRIVQMKLPAAFFLGPVDLAASKVVDPLTVVLVYKAPFALLQDALLAPYFAMVPVGYDPKKPIGTGPFKLESFQAGVQSSMVRNENYWRLGLPYLDRVVTTDVADETTQVNGLRSGQFDAINGISAASQASLHGGGFKVIVSKSGSFTPFTMRADTPPFNDVRVRQAFRLMVDRKQMNQQVWSGLGQIGNDVINIQDPNYLVLPQREQDIGQAKSLLKAAGRDGMTVNLITAPTVGGEVSTAQVFATQAQAAGVTVNVQQKTVTDYFATDYLQKNNVFSQDWYYYIPYLTTVQENWATADAPYNETGWNDPPYRQLYAQAVKTVDASKRRDLIQQMMRIEYDRGAYIIPYYIPVIDAAADKVQGITPTVSGQSLSNYDFTSIWMQK